MKAVGWLFLGAVAACGSPAAPAPAAPRVMAATAVDAPPSETTTPRASVAASTSAAPVEPPPTEVILAGPPLHAGQTLDVVVNVSHQVRRGDQLFIDGNRLRIEEVGSDRLVATMTVLDEETLAPGASCVARTIGGKAVADRGDAVVCDLARWRVAALDGWRRALTGTVAIGGHHDALAGLAATLGRMSLTSGTAVLRELDGDVARFDVALTATRSGPWATSQPSDGLQLGGGAATLSGTVEVHSSGRVTGLLTGTVFNSWGSPADARLTLAFELPASL